MVVLLSLLALAMIATGGAAVYFGFPIIQVERGWSMVIAGAGVASAGAVVLGLAGLSFQLGRMQREFRRLGDRIARAGGVGAEARPVTKPEREAPRPGAAPAPAPPRAPAPIAPPPSGRDFEPPDGSVVVGRYSSGGNSYVMYSDGSIHADTPSGHHRFESLDELKSFVAAGGESQDGPRPR